MTFINDRAQNGPKANKNMTANSNDNGYTNVNGNISHANGINNSTTNIPFTKSNGTTTPMSDHKTANISVRDYIYYLPHPLPEGTPSPYTPGLPDTNPLNLPPHASEPTSTLVLTSTTSTFVDIRFLKPFKPSEPGLPNEGGPAHRLEWAFAGKSQSFKIVDTDENESAVTAENEEVEEEEDQVTHSVWQHWIDNEYSVGAPEIPVDEGDMHPMPDGRVLEVGHSFNAALGKMQGYEEMWSDVPIKACFPQQSKFSIVLRLEDVNGGVRGVVVRVGQFCQGIVMKESQVTVERWEFIEQRGKEGEVVGGKWTRLARIGDSFLPSAVAFELEGLKQGTRVTSGEAHWIVEELAEWVD